MPLGSAARADPKGTPIADRFFLGGVGSLRGFEPHGTGPSDERRPPSAAAAAAGAADAAADGGAATPAARDALGGDLLAQGFAALQLELPFRQLRDIGIYAHVFANAGAASTFIPLTFIPLTSHLHPSHLSP